MQDFINYVFTGISSHGNTHHNVLRNSLLWIARRVLFIPVLGRYSLIPLASAFLHHLINSKNHFTEVVFFESVLYR